LRLEPGLSQRLVADTQTGDALPLLAFTLRELWERYGRDGDLTLAEYKRLGGLEGSMQRRLSAKMSARGADLSTSASLLRMEDHGLRDRMVIVIAH